MCGSGGIQVENKNTEGQIHSEDINIVSCALMITMTIMTIIKFSKTQQ